MKIIFCMYGMNVGGAEMALIRLLNGMDLDKHQITVGLLSLDGPLVKDIPSKCNVISLPMRQAGFRPTQGKTSLSKGIIVSLKKINILRSFIVGIKQKKANRRIEALPILNEEYDVAVSYMMSSVDVTKYVADKINAKYKFAWMHNELKKHKKCFTEYKDDYLKFDKIFTVSNTMRDAVAARYPNFADRVETFYNVYDNNSIIRRADEFIPTEYDYSVTRILSVGRLHKQKGFDIAIKVAKRLKSAGYKFHWYIVGQGDLQAELQKQIEALNVDDVISLLGLRLNPYPYMKHCDIYCQPSRWEGCCTTTAEAKALCKPILTTDISGASELFKNGYSGIICDISERAVYESLKHLLDDTQLREKLTQNLQNESLGENPHLKKWNEFLATEVYPYD